MKMIKDHELLKNEMLILTKKIIIWGAGKQGKELSEKLSKKNMEIEFVDSDERKAGVYCGMPIYTPQKLKEYLHKDIVIVISPDSIKVQESILKQIDVLGYRNIDIYTKPAVEAVLCFLENDRDKIQKIYGGGETETTALMKKVEMQEQMIRKQRGQMILLEHILLAELSDCSVYVYQSKKVASASLAHSLNEVGVYGVHVHSFTVLQLREHFIKSMIKKTSGKVISIVREPVARQISLLWHYWGTSGEPFLKRYSSLEEMEQYFYSIPNKEDEFQWYKKEFEEMLNINIYHYPFDRERGYSIIEKDGISVLLIKMEKINSLEKVIGNFCGVENFKLLNTNMACQKKYFYAYQNYLEHVKIPKDFFEYYYCGNKYMDYFYTEEEKK